MNEAQDHICYNRVHQEQLISGIQYGTNCHPTTEAEEPSNSRCFFL